MSVKNDLYGKGKLKLACRIYHTWIQQCQTDAVVTWLFRAVNVLLKSYG
jgi:hypothetical protein